MIFLPWALIMHIPNINLTISLSKPLRIHPEHKCSYSAVPHLLRTQPELDQKLHPPKHNNLFDPIHKSVLWTLLRVGCYVGSRRSKPSLLFKALFLAVLGMIEHSIMRTPCWVFPSRPVLF